MPPETGEYVLSLAFHVLLPAGHELEDFLGALLRPALEAAAAARGESYGMRLMVKGSGGRERGREESGTEARVPDAGEDSRRESGMQKTERQTA